MKVLIPIDGSDCSNKTLQWATQLFDRRDTEYDLIYVIPIMTEIPVAESVFTDAIAMLENTKVDLERQGCRVREAQYLLGLTVDQICRYAELEDMDLVVIGSHGRSGLSKLLLGSVSEGVLEHCRRPVIIYRNVDRPLTAKHDLPEKQISPNTVI
jgi:nucleotide-binding universal stress UspA family protein